MGGGVLVVINTYGGVLMRLGSQSQSCVGFCDPHAKLHGQV